jgi:hypothetical protein
LLTIPVAALALIFSIGLIPVVASTLRLCEIVMSGSPISNDMSWQDGDSSWYALQVQVFESSSA